jgi:hypothetical protein
MATTALPTTAGRANGGAFGSSVCSASRAAAALFAVQHGLLPEETLST